MVQAFAADWDGDGKTDLLCGVFAPTKYKDAPMRQKTPNANFNRESGAVFFLKNIGSHQNPRFADPLQLIHSTGNITAWGIPTLAIGDLDQDGDLDLIVGGYQGKFDLYENIGNRSQPELVLKGPLMADGKTLLGAQYFRANPELVDLDNDGDLDLLLPGHGWGVPVLRNIGDGRFPCFIRDGSLRINTSSEDPVRFGGIITPQLVDWNGDGSLDLLSGNESGIILCSLNVGSGASPRYEPAHPISFEDGSPVELFARDQGGSAWGAIEDDDERTSPFAADFDGDGDLDIITNSMSGNVFLLDNVGTRKTPRFARARRIDIYGSDERLVSLMRCRPGVADWNKDGVPDIVLPGPDGNFRLWLGQRSELGYKVQSYKRLFDSEGAPLQLASQGELGTTREGRMQFEVTDWDNDGDLDIIVGVKEQVHLFRQTGIPMRFTHEILVADAKGGHETGVTTGDWDCDGRLDLLTGDEQGRVWFWRRLTP